MRRAIYGLALALLAFGAVAEEQPNKWAAAIAAFEEKDKAAPPPKGAILFVGSSSIGFWRTAEAFPDYTTINRGFGGSTMADLNLYVDRIVIPYEPRQIVVYEGDNDIASGKTAEEVAADFGRFFARVREALPETRITVIGIKPSLKRWEMVDEMRKANALNKAAAEADDRIDFIDVDAPSLGEDGKPRADLLKNDELHLNEAGYALWNELLTPYLSPEPAAVEE